MRSNSPWQREHLSKTVTGNDDAFGQQVQVVMVLSQLLDTLIEPLLDQNLLVYDVCPFQQTDFATDSAN